MSTAGAPGWDPGPFRAPFAASEAMSSTSEADYTEARQSMVELIELYVQLSSDQTDK